MSRRHIDGYAFAVPAQLRQFFSVAKVRDPARPPDPPQKGSRRPEGVRLSIKGSGRRGSCFTICTCFIASPPLRFALNC